MVIKRHLVPQLRALSCCALVFLGPGVASGAELKPHTVAAFDRYIRATERRMDTRAAFLWIESLPEAERARTFDDLRRGGLFIRSLQTQDNGKPIETPDGIVHHWVGAVFIPGTTLKETVALLQNYDAHAKIYSPRIARSKLISRTGDRFRVYFRFVMTKVITVVVNTENEGYFVQPAPDRVEARFRSTRIAEVENPDTPREREKPVGMDGGYLWRLNTYWRMLERDGGVYLECESVSLSRSIPTALGWLIRPFVTSIPRESLVFTLETTRKTVGTS
jgi:hypothetical protein